MRQPSGVQKVHKVVKAQTASGRLAHGQRSASAHCDVSARLRCPQVQADDPRFRLRDPRRLRGAMWNSAKKVLE